MVPDGGSGAAGSGQSHHWLPKGSRALKSPPGGEPLTGTTLGSSTWQAQGKGGKNKGTKDKLKPQITAQPHKHTHSPIHPSILYKKERTYYISLLLLSPPLFLSFFFTR